MGSGCSLQAEFAGRSDRILLPELWRWPVLWPDTDSLQAKSSGRSNLEMNTGRDEHSAVRPGAVWSSRIERALLSRGPLAVGFAVLGAGSLALVLLFWYSHGAWPGDTFTYELAGQRLNTGGQIYDLRPTDFWYASGPPLYGPPLVAVIWRPLAALPGLLGVAIWLVAMALATLWAVALTLLEAPLLGGLATILLSLSLGLLIGVGNVDGLVLLAMIGVWRLRDRPGLAGLLLGLIVTLKLTPALLVVWLASTRRWRALAFVVLTCTGLTIIASTMSNDPGIVLRYLAVMRDGLASGFPWARYVVIVAAGVVLLASRRWPSLGFSIAVIAIPFASPVTALHTFAVMLAGLAPLMGRHPKRSVSSANEDA